MAEIGVDPAIGHGQEAVERFAVRPLADQRPLDAVSFNDMLAEAEVRRVAVAFRADERRLAGVVRVERGKTELLLPLE